VLAAALLVSGCAGMAEYPLGIPASSSPRFFASMEAVASSRGMMISKHATSLHVQTRDGDWLQYMERNGSIILLVIADTDGLDDLQIAERKAKLKQLSDELVGEARKNAAEVSVFGG
jgi:hypothetical protein